MALGTFPDAWDATLGDNWSGVTNARLVEDAVISFNRIGATAEFSEDGTDTSHPATNAIKVVVSSAADGNGQDTLYGSGGGGTWVFIGSNQGDVTGSYDFKELWESLSVVLDIVDGEAEGYFTSSVGQNYNPNIFKAMAEAAGGGGDTSGTMLLIGAEV